MKMKMKLEPMTEAEEIECREFVYILCSGITWRRAINTWGWRVGMQKWLQARFHNWGYTIWMKVLNARLRVTIMVLKLGRWLRLPY